MASGQEALLLWCKENTKSHKGVKIDNFDTSWKDGMALAALVDSLFPGKLVYATLSPKRPQRNIEIALDIAEKNGISPLVDISDIMAENVDKATMITYLSQFYKKFNTARGPIKKKPVVSLIVGKEAMVCPQCDKPLSGTTVQALSRNWHPECLNCVECNISLSGGAKIMNIKDKPYCSTCGKKAFTSTFRIGGMGMGMPGMMGGPPPGLFKKKKEEAAKEGEPTIPSGVVDIGTIRNRAKGPSGRRRPTRKSPAAATLRSRGAIESVESLVVKVDKPKHARLSQIFNNDDTPVVESPVPTHQKSSEEQIDSVPLVEEGENIKPPQPTIESKQEEPIEIPKESPKEEPIEILKEEPIEIPKEEPTESPKEEPTEIPKEEPTEIPKEESIESTKVESAKEEPKESTKEQEAIKITKEGAKESPKMETPKEEGMESPHKEISKEQENVTICESKQADAKGTEEEKEESKGKSEETKSKNESDEPEKEEDAPSIKEKERKKKAKKEKKIMEGEANTSPAKRKKKKKKGKKSSEGEKTTFHSISFEDVKNKELPPPPPIEEEGEEGGESKVETEMSLSEIQKLLDEQERLREEKNAKKRETWKTSEREKIANYLEKKEEILGGTEEMDGTKEKKIVAPAVSMKKWSVLLNKEKELKAEEMKKKNQIRLEEEAKQKELEEEEIKQRLDLLDTIKEEEVIEYNWEDLVNIRLEGFLDKQNASKSIALSVSGMNMYQWRTRWFLLQENNLIYYREKQQNILGRDCPPDGVINLYSTTSIEQVDRATGTFKVVTADKTYFLSAHDPESMDVWLKYLTNARSFYLSQKELLSHAPIASKADTEQSGYLEKLGRFNKWKSRWFVLRDGVLFRYNAKGGEQIGKFPLYKAELTEYRPEKTDGRCFQLRDAKLNATLILRAKDFEDMHHWLNNILKQKVLIEEAINSIIIE